MRDRSKTTGQRVIFLDRDGTINVDHGYVGRLEDWQFQPGAVAALRLFQQEGWKLAVVTNQSGVAAGRFTEADVERLHRFVIDQLRQLDVQLDAIAYCPHGAEHGCDCRKPGVGMARSIEAQMKTPIDFTASWTIGDKPSDVEFGQNLGTGTALLTSRYWTARTFAVQPTFIADSLLGAARTIVDQV